MRFLLGLIIGAAVVLAIAAGAIGERDWRADAETALGQLQTRAGELWRRTAADASASAPSRTDAAGDDEPPTDDAHVPATATVEASPAGTAAEPALAVAEAPDRSAVDSAPVPDPAALPPEPATEPLPRSPEPAPVERLRALSGVEHVWVPFHSEMSASGFAARLSASLDHPFRVERQGPRRYQVVFPYESEPERRALLAQAADATGLPL